MAASWIRAAMRARVPQGIAAVGLASALLGAAPASAQGIATSRVSALTSTIYARCDPSSPARQVLQRGDAVTIESVNEGWVQVRVAAGEVGCMRRSDLEPSAAVDRAAESQRARQVAAARGSVQRSTAPSMPSERVIISINASYLTASTTFDDARTFDLHRETARFSTDYSVEPSVGVDAGGFVRVWRGLAAGVAFTSHKDSRDIAIEATLPHPLIFNRDRSIEGTVSGDREATAAHLMVAYVVPFAGNKLQAVVFGGPSFFTVKQSVVTAVQFTEAYPYDEATFSGATVETEEEQKTGFNVGVDVGYYFTRNLGVGGLVRFSQTQVDFSLGEVDAGGAMVGGGLRLRF